MSFTTDLLAGLATLIDTAGVATWRPDSPYTAGETAIAIGAWPQAIARAVMLTAYAPQDDPQLPLSSLAVQVRTRSAGTDVRDVDALDDDIFDLLHGATHLVLGGVHVHQILRQSTTPMGIDEAQRFERSSNYYLDLNRPTRNRPAS